MKFAKIKFVEIFTDGTINFSYRNLQSAKQTEFYAKDSRTSLFSKKVRKKQLSHNFQQNSYKLKYKF